MKIISQPTPLEVLRQRVVGKNILCEKCFATCQIESLDDVRVDMYVTYMSPISGKSDFAFEVLADCGACHKLAFKNTITATEYQAFKDFEKHRKIDTCDSR